MWSRDYNIVYTYRYDNRKTENYDEFEKRFRATPRYQHSYTLYSVPSLSKPAKLDPH